jgi:hypothetical protein
VFRLLAIVAGALLLVLRDETRRQLSEILQTITPLCKASSAQTSVHQAGPLAESQMGQLGRWLNNN